MLVVLTTLSALGLSAAETLSAWLLLIWAVLAFCADQASGALQLAQQLALLAAAVSPLHALRLGPRAALRSCADGTWLPCALARAAPGAARSVVRGVLRAPLLLARAALGPLLADGVAAAVQRACVVRLLSLPVHAAARRTTAELLWCVVVLNACATALTSACALAWRRQAVRALVRSAAAAAQPLLALLLLAAAAYEAADAAADGSRLWAVAATRAGTALVWGLSAAPLLSRRLRASAALQLCRQRGQAFAVTLCFVGAAAQTVAAALPGEPLATAAHAAVFAAFALEVFCTRVLRLRSPARAVWDAAARIARPAWRAALTVTPQLDAACGRAAAQLRRVQLRRAVNAAGRCAWRALRPAVRAAWKALLLAWRVARRLHDALLRLRGPWARARHAAVQLGWPLGCAASAAAFASAAAAASNSDERALKGAAAAAQALTAVMMCARSLRRAGFARLGARLEAPAAKLYRQLDVWLSPPLRVALRLLRAALRATLRGGHALAAMLRAAMRPLLAALRWPLRAAWRSPHASLIASLAVLAAAAAARAHPAPLLRALDATHGALTLAWRAAVQFAPPAGLAPLHAISARCSAGLAAVDAVLAMGAHSSSGFAAGVTALHVLMAAMLRLALHPGGSRPATVTALTSFVACGAARALLLPLALVHAGAALGADPDGFAARLLRGGAPHAALLLAVALLVEGSLRIEPEEAAAPKPVRAARKAAGRAVRVAGDDACAVCLDELRAGPPVRALRCGHAFHADCVQAWLQAAQHKRCPICRALAVTDGGDDVAFMWRDVLFD